jgi:hypothetical protein
MAATNTPSRAKAHKSLVEKPARKGSFGKLQVPAECQLLLLFLFLLLTLLLLLLLLLLILLLLLLDRRYNCMLVLVRSTIVFHESLFNTLFFQFLIFTACKSFLTSSYHPFFGLTIGLEANDFHL